MPIVRGMDTDVLIILLLTVTCSLGFKVGGPPSHCADGYPIHHVSPQSTPSPFIIHLSAEEYSPNDQINITIRSERGDTFKGFQLRAQRAPGAPDEEGLVGEFITIPDGAQGQAWFPEEDVQYNCVTHTDGEVAQSEMVFVWKAPPNTEGDIVFRGPIVQQFDTFWYNVESVVLRARVQYTPPPFPHQVDNVFDNYNFLEDCGKTKGCLVYPSDCQGDTCEMAAAYQMVRDKTAVRFQLMGDVQHYLSIGFSHDKLMGHDFAVTCTNSEKGVGIENAYLPDQYSSRQRITDLTDLRAVYHNGRLYCGFTRDIVINTVQSGSDTPITSDLNQPQYLFLASGEVYPGTSIIQKHIVLPVVSEEAINVTDHAVARASSLPVELQVHATLGLLSYLYLMGFGLILARHYREELGKKVCDTALWFQSHRAVMMTVPLIAAVCVIVITVYLKSWTEAAVIHAVFGLVALGLMIINVIAGLARPGLTSSRRPTYNILHRLTGVVAYICAVVTLILGSRVSLLPEGIRNKETITIATGFGVQIIIAIVLEIVRFKIAGHKKYEISSKNQTAGGLQMEEGERGTHSCWNLKFFCLILYVIGMTPIAIAAIYFLYT